MFAVDHLARIWEEQATRKHAWQTSEAFGTAYGTAHTNSVVLFGVALDAHSFV